MMKLTIEKDALAPIAAGTEDCTDWKSSLDKKASFDKLLDLARKTILTIDDALLRKCTFDVEKATCCAPPYVEIRIRMPLRLSTLQGAAAIGLVGTLVSADGDWAVDWIDP